jgi:tripartite-type tricarboxylate transporter receptor subunit TctC
MHLPRLVSISISLSILILVAEMAYCQSSAMSSENDYPYRPIRILASEPGGNTDVVARAIAPGLASLFSQNMVVENRPAILAGATASRATPDGYTLLLGSSTLWIAPLLQEVPYVFHRAFETITLAANSPNIVVMHASSSIKSVKELIEVAKLKPGALNYASASIGSASHLGAELFKYMAGVNIVHVPYKGAGPALSALVAAQVDVSFGSAGSTYPHVKSGRVRALAVTSSQPTALAPGLPTVASAGLPGYESLALLGMFAPAKTAASIISRVNREVIRALNDADVKDRLFKMGLDTMNSTPVEAANKIKFDTARLGSMIKAAGMRLD